MPDLWMAVDTALSEVPVNVMPLLDDTDFKTIESSVAYNASGLTLVWNFVTTSGAFTQTAVTPTSGGNYDWTNQGNGMYTIEIPASGGASINNDTEGFGWLTGVATGVLPWRGPTIGFRAAALNTSLVNGSSISVDVTAISGDSTAADNLEAALDGTGGVTISGSLSGSVGSVTGNVGGNVTGSVGSVTGNVGGNVTGSVGSVTNTVSADVVSISGDSTAADNLEAALDGTGGVTISGNLSGSVGSVTGNVGGNVTGSVASVTGNVSGNVVGSVGSVASTVSADVVSISGDSTAADNLEAALDGTGGVTISGNLSGSVTSVTGNVGGNVVGSVGSVTGNVGGNVVGSVGSVTGSVGSVTGNVGGNVVGSVGSVASTVSADVVSISGDSTAADNLEAALDGTGGVTISGNLSGSVGSVTGNVGGNVVGSVGSVTGAVTVGTNNDKTGYSISGTKTTLDALNDVSAAAVADAVWDEAVSGHTALGSFGEEVQSHSTSAEIAALNDLSSSDVETACGNALSTYDPPTRAELTSDVNSIITQVDANETKIDTIDTNVDAILADTGTDGVALASATKNSIADHVLRRTLANVRASSDGDTVTFRSLLGAAAKLVNKVSVASTTLTVYEENDTTAFGTQDVTTDASAEPIVEVDTA